MDKHGPLTSLFIAGVGPAAGEPQKGSADLEALLADLFEKARSTWPGVSLAERDFVPFLAERVPEGIAVEEALKQINVDDLYLACACLKGQRQAAQAFNSRYHPEVDKALAYIDLPASLSSDVKQLVYMRLFVGDKETGPKILFYTGQGDLSSWVKVVSIRVAFNVLRSQKKHHHCLVEEDALQQIASEADQAEIQYMKRLYRSEFKQAFQGAFAGLSIHQRNLLRYQVIDRLSNDQISSIYGVHRATVTRWLAKVRKRLFMLTRQALLERLGVDPNGLDSIIRVIQSEMSASIERLLRDD